MVVEPNSPVDGAEGAAVAALPKSVLPPVLAGVLALDCCWPPPKRLPVLGALFDVLLCVLPNSPPLADFAPKRFPPPPVEAAL